MKNYTLNNNKINKKKYKKSLLPMMLQQLFSYLDVQCSDDDWSEFQ